MSLQILAEATPFDADPKVMSTVIESLAAEGYKPLLREAKRRFVEALAGHDKLLVSAKGSEVRERLYRHALMTGMRNERERLPVAGDLFLPKENVGLLYLSLFSGGLGASPKAPGQRSCYLEAGCIGLDYVVSELQEFLVAVAVVLKQVAVKANWSTVQDRNSRFVGVSQNEDLGFESGDSMTEEEVEASAILSESRIREFAGAVKRSGQMLATDVVKEDSAFVPTLEEGKLLTRECVVICRQTSNQINRVSRRERVDQMSQMGVLCSCGSPIGRERVEELLVPTALLRRMLDQSYWTSAKLVEALRRFGISADKSVFDIQHGAEEMDALADVDGKLLLFELQDEEFSMRDAYRFGGRIGMYNPDYAFIVATRGIAPDAKEHFKKVGTEAEIVYVTTLPELSSELARVIDEIRSQKASTILGEFEVLGDIGVPLRNVLLDRIRMQAAGKSKLGPQPVPMPSAAAKVFP